MTNKELVELIDVKTQPSAGILWRYLANQDKPLQIAEIGVFRGRNAEHLLSNAPNIEKYYGIDLWGEAFDKDIVITAAEAKENMEAAIKRLSVFGNKIELHESDSLDEETLSFIPDESLDFVFIDGYHSEEKVYQELVAWRKKVKPGGMIAGHDFDREDVRKALVKYLTECEPEDNQLATPCPNGCFATFKGAGNEKHLELQGTFDAKLMIATPCYGNQIFLNYANSIKALNIPHEMNWLGNESLITRARNTMLTDFYRQKQYDKLLWLDADVGVHPNDIARMYQSEYDVIGAPVRLKNAKEVKFSTHGLVKTDKPNIYEAYWVATGCLMLSRKAVNALVEMAIKNNDIYINHRRAEPGQPKYIYDVFKTAPYKDLPLDERPYLSEDYWLCDRLREAGFKVYLDASIHTTHMGQMNFEADFKTI